MTEKMNAVVKAVDMSQEMQDKVIEISKQAIDKCYNHKEIATFLKDEIRALYKGTWHCVVGRNFASYVTFEKSHYIYLYIGQIAIQVFKSG